ncbi:hypothetical protein DFJ73DRAFT_390457 [Zopfochytrium polystomum]|nr:hypothetical protein DFJ73DRAFT_390457 [Zopfochytrium polystomum]
MASYLDQVIAQPFGTPKPWYFPFVRQRRRRLSTAAAASAPPPRDPSKFQPDPAGKRAIVVLDAVDRCFGADKVVDGVSLRVYEDEVFAVLGHNGAGKSTLINMMTGIVGLSGGSGSVGGFDLETEMDGVRTIDW